MAESTTAVHVIEFQPNGWTLQHPLACRPDLFACPVNRAAEDQLTEPPTQLGRYVCHLADGDLIVGRPATETDLNPGQQTGVELARPRMVVICGSMRFERAMRQAAIEESLASKIVLLPLVNMKTWHPLWADTADAEAIKQDLDALHMAKIRMADEVLVVCPEDYIGESTRNEVAYAEQLGKPIRYRRAPCRVRRGAPDSPPGGLDRGPATHR